MYSFPPLTGLGFPEALRWHGGALYFSDMFRSAVLRWVPGEQPTTVVDVAHGGPVMPGGIGWLPTNPVTGEAGALLVVDCLERRVLAVTASAAGGTTVTVHADLSGVLNHPANDMHVDPDGTAWVGGYGFDPEHDEPAESAIVRIAQNGAVTTTASRFVFPNGFATLGDTLVVAETFADRVSAIASADTVVHLPAGSGPDGISVAADGTLYVALAFGGELVAVSGGRVHSVYRPEPITAGPGAGELSCYDCAVDPESGRIAVAVASVDEALAERVNTGRIVILDAPR